MDKEIYNNLLYLKHTEEDITNLELYFTVDLKVNGKEEIYYLKVRGDKIKVTNENKMEYIMLYSDYLLN